MGGGEDKLSHVSSVVVASMCLRLPTFLYGECVLSLDTTSTLHTLLVTNGNTAQRAVNQAALTCMSGAFIHVLLQPRLGRIKCS